MDFPSSSVSPVRTFFPGRAVLGVQRMLSASALAAFIWLAAR